MRGENRESRIEDEDEDEDEQAKGRGVKFGTRVTRPSERLKIRILGTGGWSGFTNRQFFFTTLAMTGRRGDNVLWTNGRRSATIPTNKKPRW
jgi:hypothetical protein